MTSACASAGRDRGGRACGRSTRHRSPSGGARDRARRRTGIDCRHVLARSFFERVPPTSSPAAASSLTASRPRHPEACSAHGMGGNEDWDKPQIGIASSWNGITPCNLSLDRLTQGAKEGVHSGGRFGRLCHHMTYPQTTIDAMPRARAKRTIWLASPNSVPMCRSTPQRASFAAAP